MKNQFGNLENDVLKCCSQTIHNWTRETTEHYFCLLLMQLNLIRQFFDLDIENPLGGGTLAKFRSSMYVLSKIGDFYQEPHYKERPDPRKSQSNADVSLPCRWPVSLRLFLFG